MEERDIDNGAAFPAKDEQALILTGKLSRGGDSKPIAIVKDTDHKGNDVLCVYERVAVMYRNEDATEQNKQPAYSGPCDPQRRIAGWYQSKGDMKYLSFKVSDRQQPQQVQPAPSQAAQFNDEAIPF